MPDQSNNELENKPGEKFGYLKSQYAPQREIATQVIKESGIGPDAPGFKRLRRKLAGKLLEKQNEGEIDILTGLLNEKGFNRRFQEEASRIKRSGESSTLFYIDANNLKLTNDQDGHDAGNELLKKISSTLRGSIRATDILARLHGDEFAAILVGEDLDGAKRLWDERLSKLLQDEGLSIAIGATIVDPNGLEDSIKKADAAMYKAKVLSKEGVEEGKKATMSSIVLE